MRVAIFVDKYTTAIDRLAEMVKKHNPQIQIEVLAVHPKRNDADTLYKASQLLEWCDVIDVHYWKSGEVLRSTFGMFFNKPKVVFHFNPYDIDKLPFNELYDAVVVGNESIHNRMPYAHLIKYGVDLDFFAFNQEYVEPSNKVVNMVVGRIEGKKGVLPIAQACKNLGYKLRLVGRVSSPEYMKQVMDTGVVEFMEDANEENLRSAYYGSAVHVCNSIDGFESGTLPILEAMACGVPVLTRRIGHVPDIENGKNMVAHDFNEEDVENISILLKDLIENHEWRLKLRANAYDSVRNYDSRRMADKVANLYYQLYMPDRKLVSIVMPTKDNPEAFSEALLGAVRQDYKKFEIIVADSGDNPVKVIVDAVRKHVDCSIRYIHFPHRNTYSLAEARNRGIIEASGDIIVFCDDRIRMQPNAVTEFVTYLTPNNWVWGVKDGIAKGFVENFSAIFRKDIINGGMFCERMQYYGGMTQEVRTRFERRPGFEFVLVNSAKADGARSHSRTKRRKDIVEAKYLVSRMYQ